MRSFLALSPVVSQSTVSASARDRRSRQVAALASVTSTRTAGRLLQERANTEAGLAKNAYECPNPACQSKTLGTVTATAKAGFPDSSPFTLFALLATAFDLFGPVHHSGLMEYDWSATVTCS